MPADAAQLAALAALTERLETLCRLLADRSEGSQRKRSEPVPRFVDDRQVYPLREAARRLGWKEHATRQAKRKGLRVIRHGREDYVLGSDLLAFFRGLAEDGADREDGIHGG